MRNIATEFKIGDVLLHKVDSRRVVVVGYEYEKPPNIITGVVKGRLTTNQKEIERIKKEKKVVGLICRLKDMHNNLTQQSFIPEEFDRPKVILPAKKQKSKKDERF